jgi:hypothetical protein
MRIATLMLALVLMLVIIFQSCAAFLGGAVTADQGFSQGGAIGFLVALLYLIGAAFVIGLPWVSVIAFLLAGAFGLLAGTSTRYSDLSIWGVVALILAVMSFLGVRERRRTRARPTD